MSSVAVLGTDFEVGKSFVVSLLCRYLRERGKVTPFKGISLTNQVIDSPRIAFAQAVQAKVANTKPDQRMNPVLLVPSKNRVEIYVEGEKLGLYRLKEIPPKILEQMKGAVEENAKSLLGDHEFVCVEGMGNLSPSVELGTLNRLMEIGNWHATRVVNARVVLCSRDLEGLSSFVSRLPQEDRERVKLALTNRLDLIQTVLEWGYKEREAKLLAAVFRLFYRKPNKLKFLGILPEFPELSGLPPLDPPTGKHPAQVDKWVEAIEGIWGRAKEYMKWGRLDKIL
ncbi:MAG: hypothetical protein QXH26_01870 [Candidatus Hadarchaeales archaeon]